MKQKVLILTPKNQDLLQEHLDSGWFITQTCAMPSSVADYPASNPPTCLVVLQESP